MEPNFDRDHNEGQMCVKERQALYNAVVRINPKVACEVGTWKGGGSTYIISAALHECNSGGRLYTCEADKVFHDHAVDLYLRELRILEPFIDFNFGESQKVFPKLLRELGTVDFLLLDGKEDAEQTVTEYKMFLPYLSEGSLLACHDWKTDKMRKLKPFIDEEVWNRVVALNDTDTGFMIFEKRL